MVLVSGLVKDTGIPGFPGNSCLNSFAQEIKKYSHEDHRNVDLDLGKSLQVTWFNLIILQMEKLRPRKVERLAQSHTGSN